MEPMYFIYLTPVVAIIALIFAYMRAAWVQKQDPGTERMQIIGKWIADGAMAFLKQEYRVLAIFVVAVAILLGVSNQMVGAAQNTNGIIAISFVLGAFCSALAGYFGMKTATAANIRTAGRGKRRRERKAAHCRRIIANTIRQPEAVHITGNGPDRRAETASGSPKLEGRRHVRNPRIGDDTGP